ncbi:MAG: hypothetical protein JXA20_10265 [Spirochaetes bacterium]|nr:hypothetical protein [Spirochaetota bacterium]
MAENLIEEIRSAEAEAARVVDEAVKTGEARLEALRERLEAETIRFDGEFPSARREILAQTSREAEAIRKETEEAVTAEIARLEEEAQGRREAAIRFILRTILGE